jgi:hypothetical protein
MDESTVKLFEYLGWAQAKEEDLLSLGTKKFGPPDATTVEALKKIPVFDLEDLIVRVLEVSSWRELLARPGE